MAKTKKQKKRVPTFEVGDKGFVLGRDTTPIKPPTKKELDRMRQREIIRKNPTGTI